MMTNYQRQLFSELVDLNWEADQDYPQVVKNALVNEYFRVEDELKELMGKEGYRMYIEGMRQMFAPVESN
jgi:hypothetical protein